MSENLLDVARPYWTQGERNENWPLNISSIAYAKALVVKRGPGKLYGFTVYNSNAGTQFVLLYNTRDIPASGAAPAAVFSVQGASTLGVYFGDTGRAFDAGCVLVNSSTGPTYTAGAADCWFDAQYV